MEQTESTQMTLGAFLRGQALRATVKNYLPAAVCAITPILCYFLIRPFAEIGIGDDWSYIKSAQVLAQTGHIAYNGWAAPILGWQLYFGAFFIKLFGFSFTTVRLCTVVEAVATAFLLQRTFIRAGLNSWNAFLATMTFVVSPQYLPLAYVFKTDISSMLCIVVCLYMCLRALQTQSDRSAMVWICAAALVNAVGGTARQIIWMGLLVMVPCTLWLLRKSRQVLLAGCICWLVGVVFMLVAMHWFARQPYSVPEPLIPDKILLRDLEILVGLIFRSVGLLALLALPVLLMFGKSMRFWNRRAAAAFGIGFFGFVVWGIALIRIGKLNLWLAPFLWEIMTDSSTKRLSVITALRIQPGNPWDGLGLLLTAALVLGILFLVACAFAGPHRSAALQQETSPISWQKLGILVGIFSAAYAALLGLNSFMNPFLSRYLLPLLAILLLVLARYYQEKVETKLPWASALLILIFAGFSIAATHDTFAQYRANASAADEIRSSGVPATAIIGQWEMNDWTQVEKVGFINNPKIRVPRGAYVPPPVRPFRPNCSADPSLHELVPAIRPAYVVTSDPGDCGGQTAFPPVMYRTWIAPHTNWIYALKLPPDFLQ